MRVRLIGLNVLQRVRDHTTGLTLAVLALLVLPSCAVQRLPARSQGRAARPVPPALLSRYTSPDKGPVKVDLALKQAEASYRHYVGHFECRAPFSTAPHKVSFDYYQAPLAKAPVIVCTPILGGRGALERGVARSFAMRGFHAVLVHRSRRFFKRPVPSAAIEAKLREAIADRRRVIDWLCQRPEVDPQRIGAFGISMGGIVTSILTPLDARIHSAVMVMAGGDLPQILTSSEERPLVRYCEKRMANEGLSLEQLKHDLEQGLVTDPLTIAGYADPKRLLFIASRYDNIVPTPLQLRLRRALGEPEGVLIPTGHYTAIAFLPLLRKMTVTFFKQRFQHPNSLLVSRDKQSYARQTTD